MEIVTITLTTGKKGGRGEGRGGEERGISPVFYIACPFSL
jgi:hypothetical protein